jgi:hypothetical protein
MFDSKVNDDVFVEEASEFTKKVGIDLLSGGAACKRERNFIKSMTSGSSFENNNQSEIPIPERIPDSTNRFTETTNEQFNFTRNNVKSISLTKSIHNGEVY